MKKLLGQNICVMSVWLQSSYEGRRPGDFYQGKPKVTNRSILLSRKRSLSLSLPNLTHFLSFLWGNCQVYGMLLVSILSVPALVLQNPSGFPRSHSLAVPQAVCSLPSVLYPLYHVRIHSLPLGTREQAPTFVLVSFERNSKLNVKRKKALPKCILRSIKYASMGSCCSGLQQSLTQNLGPGGAHQGYCKWQLIRILH